MKKLSTQAPLIREAEERELSALQKDWREYFGAKLNKFNAKSPADMSEDEKKAFFNDLKKDWERGKGATAAGKKDIEAQGVKENEDVKSWNESINEAMSFDEIKDKYLDNPYGIGADAIEFIDSERGNSRKLIFRHGDKLRRDQIEKNLKTFGIPAKKMSKSMQDKAYKHRFELHLYESINEESMNEGSTDEMVKRSCVERLSQFFRVSPNALSHFKFDGTDNIKALTKALNSPSDEGTEAYYKVAIKVGKQDAGIEESINEADIKSEAEFKEYAETVLRKAFGDKYDQKKADETVDGILKKADGDYGAAVGMLTSGLSETDSEEDVYEEFAEIDENLSLSNLGVEGDILYILINGNKYGYKAPAGKDIEDLAKSFAGMAKHSAGKALSWIKKNAELVFGSKKVTESVNEGLGVFVTDDRFNDLDSLKADIEKKIGPAFNNFLARQGIKYNPVTIKEDRGRYQFASKPVTGKDIGFLQYGIIEAYIESFGGGKVPRIQEVDGKIQFDPLIFFNLHYSYVHGSQKDKHSRGSNGCALYPPGENSSNIFYNILTGAFMTDSEAEKAKF